MPPPMSRTSKVRSAIAISPRRGRSPACARRTPGTSTCRGCPRTGCRAGCRRRGRPRRGRRSSRRARRSTSAWWDRPSWAWRCSCRGHLRESDADDLQAPAEGAERELVDLGGAVAEQVPVAEQVLARRDEHAGGDGDQLGELLLRAARERRVVLAGLLEVPGAVGDVAVLVLA